MVLMATMADSGHTRGVVLATLAPGPGQWQHRAPLPCLLQRLHEEIPEIDVDELLDMEHDSAWTARVEELLADCYKPTEAFTFGLLDKIWAMKKLSPPQKKEGS